MHTTSFLPLALLATSAYGQVPFFANSTICTQTDDGFASIINGTYVEVDCAIAAQTCRFYLRSNNAYWTARMIQCDSCNRAESCCRAAPNVNQAQCSSDRAACGVFNSTIFPSFYVSQAFSTQTVCQSVTSTSASASASTSTITSLSSSVTPFATFKTEPIPITTSGSATSITPSFTTTATASAEPAFSNAAICSQTDDGFASIVNGTFKDVDCAVALGTCHTLINHTNAYWNYRSWQCDACNRAEYCCRKDSLADQAACSSDRIACGSLTNGTVPAFYSAQATNTGGLASAAPTVCQNAPSSTSTPPPIFGSASATGSISSSSISSWDSLTLIFGTGTSISESTSRSALPTNLSFSQASTTPSPTQSQSSFTDVGNGGVESSKTTPSSVQMFTGAASRDHVVQGGVAMLAAAGLAAMF